MMTEKTLDEIVRPDLREEWEVAKKKWFVSNHNCAAELRRPGYMKTEWYTCNGGIVCLAPKSYCATDFDRKEDDKVACKGVSKKDNPLNYQVYKDILYKDAKWQGTNVSFLRRQGKIVTARTTKRSLRNINYKTYIEDDMVCTRPFKRPRYIE